MRSTLACVFAALLFAPLVTAQKAPPAEGDLIPRAGTLAYITSDRPQVIYRLFGTDPNGGWKLRTFIEAKLDEEFAERADSEEAEQARTVIEYVFNTYESVSRAEFAVLDVTVDGPKYLMLLHAADGKAINIAPEFLQLYVTAEHSFMEVKYIEYRVPAPEPVFPDDEEDGMRRPPPKPAMFGFDRYYVASIPSGVIISNFESSIRDAIERLASGNYSESLSGREEFKEWTTTRSKHDLSIFLIGRELQNAIERVLPSEEQAGIDAPGIYRTLDSWVQLREYRYIVLDLDYDEKARGATVAATFKTRRQTRLLEKLAIAPAEFKLLRYMPQDAMAVAGMQIGDANTTFNNFRELGYDIEKWLGEFMGGGRDGGSAPDAFPMPPEEEAPTPLPPEDSRHKSQEAEDPDAEAGSELQSEIDRALAELDEMLAGYGTSLQAILDVLGTEVVLGITPDVERAKAAAKSFPGFNDAFEHSNVLVAIALKDVEKARAILASAREKDTKGAFRGFEEKDAGGGRINVSPEHPFGWAFTSDALLIAVVNGLDDQDAEPQVTAALSAMLQSARSTGAGRSFSRNSSKFFEMDFGVIARIEQELVNHQSRRLDRYAMPPMDSSPTQLLQDMVMAMRTREAKDGVEVALRVTGLPDFGALLESGGAMFGGSSPDRNAYSYGESNLRTLGEVLQARAGSDKALNLDDMIKERELRAGALQLPFDERWQGDRAKLSWTTLDQVTRDEAGELPPWVDQSAAAMIEANEKAGFRSIVLVEGDIASWMKEWKSGFIVAYQGKAETLGGHMVLYADGQTGWLHAAVLKDALKLNAEGKPVPVMESDWLEEEAPSMPEPMPPEEE